MHILKNKNTVVTIMLILLAIILTSYAVLTTPKTIPIGIDINEEKCFFVSNNGQELFNIKTTIKNLGYRYKNMETYDNVMYFNKLDNKLYKAIYFWLYLEIPSKSGELYDDLGVVFNYENQDKDYDKLISSFNYVRSDMVVDYDFDTNTITYIPPKDGYQFSLIRPIFLDNIDNIQIKAEKFNSVYDFSKQPEIISRSQTIYSGDIYEARNGNMGNALNKLNGVCINPGEIFSLYEKISPFTKENGYETAGVIIGNTLSEDIGGGVCQVATTLYNAVIRAELEVVERHNHSMMVGYVEPSFDATIAGKYVDLKFKNTSKHPVYIFSNMKDNIVEILLIGEIDKPDNKVIEFNSYYDETEQCWYLEKSIIVDGKYNYVILNKSKYK